MQQEAIQIQREALSGQQIPPDLGRAFVRGEQINPEFGLDWLSNLASTTISDNETAYLYTARGNEGEFLVLPMRVNHKTKEAHSLSNFYTSLYAPIAQSTRPRFLLQALLQYLRKSERLSTITLSPLVADDPTFEDCIAALTQSNWRGIHSWRCFWNWTHTLTSGNYADYLAARPSILRNTIARKTRKFLDSDRGRIELITEIESVDIGIRDFQSVYQRSWKKAEPHIDFIPGLITLAASKKWLRLAIAYYDEQAIAAQLWLVSNGTASIFKLAYDENFKKLSPGTVLSAFLMEQVIDVDQVTTVDYLSGDDSYKESWMTSQRERRGIAAYNINTSRGMLHCAARQLKQFTKKIKR